MSSVEFTNTQAALVCFLAGQGRSAEEIAVFPTMSATPSQIRGLCISLGLPSMRTDAHDSFRVTLDRKLCLELDEHASARNVGRAEVAKKILEAALNGQIVDAVLDDGVTT